jgi:hypothetical protein
MKTYRGIGLIIVYMLHAILLPAQNAPASNISKVYPYETVISVPVTLSNFHTIGSLLLTLKHNPLLVSYNSITNHSGLPGFSALEAEPGTIQVTGTLPPPPEGNSGFFLNDNDTLLILAFNKLSGLSGLEWLNNASSCQHNNWPGYFVLNQNSTSDYYLNVSVALPPLSVSYPEPVFFSTCSSSEVIISAFAAWINGFNYNGGCNPTATDLGNLKAPDPCGGSLTFEYIVTDEAGQSQSCGSSFTVEAAPAAALNCAANRVITGHDQDVIDGLFMAWLANSTFSSDCKAFLTNSNYIETPNPDKSNKIFQLKSFSSHNAQTVNIEYFQPEVGEVISLDGKQLYKTYLHARPPGKHNDKMQIGASGILLNRIIFSSALHTETITKKIYINPKQV